MKIYKYDISIHRPNINYLVFEITAIPYIFLISNGRVKRTWGIADEDLQTL